MSIKEQIKRFCPPIIVNAFKGKSKYGYFGNYKTWQQAKDNSGGYDSDLILEKVKDSLLKVKNGEMAYERDSVLFDQKQYSWPLLAGLLFIASEDKNRLNVLDFGGSLGSSYFQNKDLLKNIDLKWYIAEQDNFIQCGKKYFEDNVLKFVDGTDNAPIKDISVFIASSSLQYLEDPYDFMKKIIIKGFPYIIIDRTLFLPDREKICVQKVRPEIYDASYPVWFMNEKKFLDIFADKYEMISDFYSFDGKVDLGGEIAIGKGFIFRKV